MASAKPSTTSVARGETFPHPVEVPLNDREIVAYADELMKLDTEQQAADALLNSAKGTHKQESERVAAERGIIAHKLRTKREYRDFECYNQLDYYSGVCEIRRADTDDLVTTRPMNEKEFRGERLFKEQEDALKDQTVDAEKSE